MKWRDANDFPDETGEQLVEVERRGNGEVSVYPTYIRFIKRDNFWMNPPEGYKVKRWLDESPNVSGWSDAEVVDFLEWSRMCINEREDGDFEIHIDDKWQQKSFAEIVDYYKTYHKPSPSTIQQEGEGIKAITEYLKNPTSGNYERMVDATEPPSHIKGEEEDWIMKDNNDWKEGHEIGYMRGFHDAQMADPSKLLQAKDEEVKKLVAMLEYHHEYRLKHHSKYSDSALFDITKAALQPYMKSK